MKNKKICTISMAHLNKKGLYKTIGILSKMGYVANVDFRVVHTGGDDSAELVIMNRRLKKDIKLMSTLNPC